MIGPTSGPTTVVGRTARSDHRRPTRARGAVTRLTFGVGHGCFTDRFAWNDFHSEALRHETPIVMECGSGAVLEAPALVAGLDDIAMMSETVEQCRGHLGVTEHGGPFAKSQVCRYDHRSLLVEAADQVEQQLSAGQSEWQITKFVDLCRAQHKSIHVQSAVMWSCQI